MAASVLTFSLFVGLNGKRKGLASPSLVELLLDVVSCRGGRAFMNSSPTSLSLFYTVYKLVHFCCVDGSPSLCS